MILAGTGHRPNKLGGYGTGTTERLVKLATKYLVELKPDVVISGMALGWDQALALAATQQDIEWWAYVPFKGQDNFWPPKSKELYHILLGQADVVRIVSPNGYHPQTMQVRNRAMVDDCDKLLALWSGTPGGTANCLQYAREIGKPVINIWDEWRLQ